MHQQPRSPEKDPIFSLDWAVRFTTVASLTAFFHKVRIAKLKEAMTNHESF